IAASTAVFTTSCIPSWAMTVSSVPLPVPMPSCTLVAFITGSFPAAYAAFHGFEHTHCQGDVLGHHHHLGGQLQRRCDDQLAGDGERLLHLVVKCRLPRFGAADGCCCFFHIVYFSFVFNDCDTWFELI